MGVNYRKRKNKIDIIRERGLIVIKNQVVRSAPVRIEMEFK